MESLIGQFPSFYTLAGSNLEFECNLPLQLDNLHTSTQPNLVSKLPNYLCSWGPEEAKVLLALKVAKGP